MRVSDKAEGRSSASHLPLALAIFAWGLPVLWVLSLARIVLDRLVLRVKEPWVLPGRFEDFFCYWGRVRLVHTAAFFTAPDSRRFGSGWGYPAPPIFVYRVFYLFDPAGAAFPYRGYAVMVALTLGAILWMSVKVVKELRRRGLGPWGAVGLTASGAVLSWPLFLALQRGNIEMLLWLPLAVAIRAFTQRRWMLSALLIGLTASFKIYPIILLALFLRERRWKEILAALAVAAGVTLLGLAYIGPTFKTAASHLGLGVQGFIAEHGGHVNWHTEGLSHSLFHVLKMRLIDRPEELPRLIPLYMLVLAVVMTAVFFWRVIRMPYLNQVMVLCISMIYLPAMSYDYTLLLLLVPCAWLVSDIVSSVSGGREMRGSTAAMLLFTLILGPEIFLSKGEYLYSGTVKAICLGALLVLVLVIPFGAMSEAGRLKRDKSTGADLHGDGSAGTLRKSQ